MWHTEFPRRVVNGARSTERLARLGSLLVVWVCLVSPLRAQTELYITGIRAEGAKGTDPTPEMSIYLESKVVGFIATQYAVGYHFEAKVIKEHTNTLYLEAQLENPDNKKNPIIYRTQLKPGAKDVVVRHGPVQNVKMKSSYLIKIVLYEDAEYFKPVDVLEQKVRAHVDTRKKITAVDPDFAPKH